MTLLDQIDAEVHQGVLGSIRLIIDKAKAIFAKSEEEQSGFDFATLILEDRYRDMIVAYAQQKLVVHRLKRKLSGTWEYWHNDAWAMDCHDTDIRARASLSRAYYAALDEACRLRQAKNRLKQKLVQQSGNPLLPRIIQKQAQRLK